MHGWLALVGGNEWTDGCDFDADLVKRSATNTVTVLPTAAAFEQPDAAVRTATSWFAALGAIVVACPILARRDAEDTTLAAQLAASSFIYIAGGSPMHLRSVLKDTPALDALVEAWRGGATLAASSAGAMALGDPMLDPRGGAFTLGLGVVPGLAVLPHAHEWSDERTKRTMRLAGSNVTVAMISERTALLRDPTGAWRVEGAGSVRIHANGTDTSDLSNLRTLTFT